MKKIKYFKNKFLYFIFLFPLLIFLFFLIFSIITTANNQYYLFLGSAYFKSNDISYILIFPYLNFNLNKFDNINYLNFNFLFLSTFNDNYLKLLNSEINLTYKHYFSNNILNINFFSQTNDFPNIYEKNLPYFFTGSNISLIINKINIIKINLYTDYQYFLEENSDIFNSFININYFGNVNKSTNLNINFQQKILSENKFSDNFLISYLTITPIFNINPTVSILFNIYFNYSYYLTGYSNYYISAYYNFDYYQILKKDITLKNLLHFQLYKFFINLESEDIDKFLLINKLNIEFNFIKIILNLTNRIECHLYLNDTLNHILFDNIIKISFNLIKYLNINSEIGYLINLNPISITINERTIILNLELDYKIDNLTISFSNAIKFLLNKISNKSSLGSSISLQYKINETFITKISLYYKITYDKLNNLGEELFYLIFGINFYF
ncbi:MAG: hypothetical protein N3A58_04570 [Spirochaetes bacterium]|nr:hypothetical protein [Spirochaetota bacterium]